jgi:hypothetical protein
MFVQTLNKNLNLRRSTLIIVEHDPMLYDDAAEMVEYISAHALSDAAKEAAVLLYVRSIPGGFDGECR